MYLVLPKTAGQILKPIFILCFLLGLLVLCACVGQKTVVFRPETVFIPEFEEPSESKQLIESQNGPADVPLPEWINRVLYAGTRNRANQQVEAQAKYRDKYVFIGKNRGTNFNALRQWAEGFTIAQDFPQLAARRIESRLFATASLYPDDEYGDFFEVLIKNSFDAEYPEAVKEESFWIKWLISGNVSLEQIPSPGKDEQEIELDTADTPDQEIYEFFVLISIDKEMMQSRVRALLANTRTAVSPTRDQAAAISRTRQIFFEGF